LRGVLANEPHPSVDNDLPLYLLKVITPTYSRIMPHDHSHDQSHSHAHDQAAIDHGHTHEILDGPGSYMGREMPIIEGRDWSERAFTIGIGG